MNNLDKRCANKRQFAHPTLAELLGKAENCVELQSFIKNLDIKPTIEDFDGERRYYSFPTLGVSIVLDENKISAIQLLSKDADEEMGAYQGSLPNQLEFSDSSESVVKKLGVPDKFKEGVDDPRPFVYMRPWCKYFFENYSLHIEFTMDKSAIRLVTLQKKG